MRRPLRRPVKVRSNTPRLRMRWNGERSSAATIGLTRCKTRGLGTATWIGAAAAVVVDIGFLLPALGASSLVAPHRGPAESPADQPRFATIINLSPVRGRAGCGRRTPGKRLEP